MVVYPCVWEIGVRIAGPRGYDRACQAGEPTQCNTGSKAPQHRGSRTFAPPTNNRGRAAPQPAAFPSTGLAATFLLFNKYDLCQPVLDSKILPHRLMREDLLIVRFFGGRDFIFVFVLIVCLRQRRNRRAGIQYPNLFEAGGWI